MAVTPTPAPAPVGAATPPAPAATVPRTRPHGILDVFAIMGAALYAVATFMLCVFGASMLHVNAFSGTQDAWGAVTVFNIVLQTAPVLLTPASYTRSTIGMLEKLSSSATLVAVVVVLTLHLVLHGLTMPPHWAFMIWLYAAFAAIVDIMALRHAYWLAR